MDLAIELAKCKEAAEKCARVDGAGEYSNQGIITTALMEARADATRQISIRLAEINVEYGWLDDLAARLQAEVHARRQRGL